MTNAVNSLAIHNSRLITILSEPSAGGLALSASWFARNLALKDTATLSGGPTRDPQKLGEPPRYWSRLLDPIDHGWNEGGHREMNTTRQLVGRYILRYRNMLHPGWIASTEDVAADIDGFLVINHRHGHGSIPTSEEVSDTTP